MRLALPEFGWPGEGVLGCEEDRERAGPMDGPAQEGGGVRSQHLHWILIPIPGLAGLVQVAWSCTSNFTGPAPSGAAGADPDATSGFLLYSSAAAVKRSYRQSKASSCS